ncbi:phosphohydrolase [Bacteroidia bacterium]|nr:phosphohydrolase [Bacteroidia bacterium]
MEPILILKKYYPEGSQAYDRMLTHCLSVAYKALAIVEAHPELVVDKIFVYEAALLHDIGAFLTNAPSIGCHGEHPYIEHGRLGAELMRREGFEKHARVCERHTGTGISLPEGDFFPETVEEKLICYADTFFSKTRLDEEKTVEQVKTQLAKYGEDSVARFEEMHKLFKCHCGLDPQSHEDEN